jgi:predicted ATP-dependent serine protease
MTRKLSDVFVRFRAPLPSGTSAVSKGQCNACKEWNTIAEEIIQKQEK